jgi:hypothetical protein
MTQQDELDNTAVEITQGVRLGPMHLLLYTDPR